MVGVATRGTGTGDLKSGGDKEIQTSTFRECLVLIIGFVA